MNQESLYLWAGLQECERILFKKQKEKKKGKGKREGKGKGKRKRKRTIRKRKVAQDLKFKSSSKIFWGSEPSLIPLPPW